jgi:hypothetical protein
MTTTNEMQDKLHEERRAEGAKIDPRTAEVICCKGDLFNPYGDYMGPEHEWNYGRLYFARRAGGDWIELCDIPEEAAAEIRRLCFQGFYDPPDGKFVDDKF